MSNVSFTVKNARKGTTKQKEVGIMATFSLRIEVDGACIVQGSDLMIRINKSSGEAYIGSPGRSFEGDKGSKGFISYFKLFPDEKNSPLAAQIIDQVKKEIEKAPATKKSYGGGGTYNKPPANQVKESW